MAHNMKKKLLNFRNEPEQFSIFPLFFKLFDMTSMQNSEKKSEKFKLSFSRIVGTSYNHLKTFSDGQGGTFLEV